MSAFWNIYCVTENNFKSQQRGINDPPNVCPLNPSHEVVSESSSVSSVIKVSTISGDIKSTNSTSYVPLYSYIFQGTEMVDVNPFSVKIVASIDFGTYDFCFVNVNNFDILYESTGNAETTPLIITIPMTAFGEMPVSEMPVSETPIDIKFKTTGGTITIRSISLCFSKSL